MNKNMINSVSGYIAFSS